VLLGRAAVSDPHVSGEGAKPGSLGGTPRLVAMLVGVG